MESEISTLIIVVSISTLVQTVLLIMVLGGTFWLVRVHNMRRKDGSFRWQSLDEQVELQLKQNKSVLDVLSKQVEISESRKEAEAQRDQVHRYLMGYFRQHDGK